MRLTMDRAKLATVVSQAASFAGQAKVKPVLGCVLIEVDSDRVTVAATNGNCEFVGHVEHADPSVKTAWRALCPADRLGAILREATSDSVSLELKGLALHLRAGAARVTLGCLNADELPRMSLGKASGLAVPARAFRDALHRVKYVTDNEDGRFSLANVAIDATMGDEDFHLVASDGRRLAASAIPRTAGQPVWSSVVLVPSKVASLVERLLTLSGADDVLRIDADENDKVSFQSESWSVISVTTGGRFPRWRDVIPKRRESAVVDLVAGALLHALAQAIVVCEKTDASVKLTLDNGTLAVDALSSIGDSTVSVPVSYEGDKIAAMLQHRYLSEFLRVVQSSETVRLDMLDADSALLFTAGPTTYVMMPLASEAVG